jgi:hypothetical protein
LGVAFSRPFAKPPSLSYTVVLRGTLTLLVLLATVATDPVRAAVKRGPTVGDRIPAFSAPDQNGQTQTLSTIAGPKGAMLVFFRSADW